MTKDTVVPVISRVELEAVDQSLAIITWRTNERTTSQVKWGTDTTYGNLTTICSDLKMSHSVAISGLTPETLYHFRVKSTDKAGNRTISASQTFTTLAKGVVIRRRRPAPVDNIPPVISRIEVAEITQDRAVISWRTDEPASSLVEHGLTSKLNQLAGEIVEKSIIHQVILENLTPETKYYFRVVSVDAAGNRVYSPSKTFKTLVKEATEPPVDEPIDEIIDEITIEAIVSVNIETGEVEEVTVLTIKNAIIIILPRTIAKNMMGDPLIDPITIIYKPVVAKEADAITAYDFGPDGVTFSPPFELIIQYDDINIPEGYSELDLVIKLYSGGVWIPLETDIEPEANRAKAKVSHFSTFALFAELLAVDPAVEPAPPAVDPADPVVDPADPAVEPAPPAVGSADPVVDPADPVVDSIDPAVKPIEYPVARDNKLLFIIIGIFILAGIIFVAIKKRKKDR